VAPTDGATEGAKTMVLTTALGVLLVLVLAALRGTSLPDDPSTTEAGGYYCVVVRDGQGRPVNTTCVPWPLG
jgi:hypothetical protein